MGPLANVLAVYVDLAVTHGAVELPVDTPVLPRLRYGECPAIPSPAYVGQPSRPARVLGTCVSPSAQIWVSCRSCHGRRGLRSPSRGVRSPPASCCRPTQGPCHLQRRPQEAPAVFGGTVVAGCSGTCNDPPYLPPTRSRPGFCRRVSTGPGGLLISSPPYRGGAACPQGMLHV